MTVAAAADGVRGDWAALNVTQARGNAAQQDAHEQLQRANQNKPVF